MTTFNDASDVPLADMSSRYPDQDQISKRNSIVLNIKPVSTTINGDIVVSLIRTPDMAINDYGGIETEPCIDNADHGDRLNGELVISSRKVRILFEELAIGEGYVALSRHDESTYPAESFHGY